MFPAGIYSEFFKLAMQTNEMFASSAVTILHRQQMIKQAMDGSLPWTDPEFARMWQEKTLAGAEAFFALWQSAAQGKLNRSVSENIKTAARMARPYHRKAKANAKRLNKPRSS